MNLMQFNPPPDPAPADTCRQRACHGKLYPGVYGIEAYHDPVANNPAIMWYKNVSYGRQSGLLAGGLEAINPDQYVVRHHRCTEKSPRRADAQCSGLAAHGPHRRHHPRQKLQRQRHLSRCQRVCPRTASRSVSGILTTYGTARTQNDGSYVIEGLDATGIYTIDARKAGFITQHATGALFHGGYEGRSDFYLIQAQPAIIEGNISTLTGGLPVSGAIVQAKDITDPTDPNPTCLPVRPSDTNGNYVIRNLPASTTGSPLPTWPRLGYSGSQPTIRRDTTCAEPGPERAELQTDCSRREP